MSWHGRKILEDFDIQAGAGQTPSRFQVGEEVKLWVEDGRGNQAGVQAWIASVKIEGMHKVIYDLAFRIEGTQLYAVVPNFHGWITDTDATGIDRDGGFIEAQRIIVPDTSGREKTHKTESTHLHLVTPEPDLNN